MSVPVLLSRTLDPLLGVFTGVLAYGMYERNPRSGLSEEERLGALVGWRVGRWRDERARREGEGEEVVKGVEQLLGEEKKA